MIPQNIIEELTALMLFNKSTNKELAEEVKQLLFNMYCSVDVNKNRKL